jgi:hypothetical protein
MHMLNSMHCQRKYKYDEFDNNIDKKGWTVWYVRVVTDKYIFHDSVQWTEFQLGPTKGIYS